MSDIAIRIEGLSKRYRLGTQDVGGGMYRYKSLRDSLGGLIKRPMQAVRSTFVREPMGEQNSFWALNDVNFDVKRGEVVGIIGRNGAGKSTLLKILSRITKPTVGRIDLRGRVGSLLEVGTGFHPELSGRENIYLNGAILGMTRAEVKSKFDEIVAFSEIERFLDTPVKQYSSGMYTRLAFAVAAHLEPEILVVDEVLAVGDAAFQRKCLGKMRDVATEGRTVLFVSHSLSVVRSLCKSGCWLNGGRVQAIGAIGSVVEDYLRSDSHAVTTLIDLKSLRRTGDFGNQVRLTNLLWISGQPLVHGERLSVQLELEVARDTEDLAIGIGFSTLEGTRLLTYETDLFGIRKSVLSGERWSVVAEIEHLPLAPGYYSLDVGCRSGDLYGVDYLPSFNRIEVVPGPKTPGTLSSAGAGVRIGSEWTWKANNG